MSILTFSRNVFLPVTDLCRNRCGYCSFRREPGKARIISRKEARVLLEQGARSGCTEALFSLGESPQSEESYNRLAAAAGISDLTEYLVELCELALDAGLLPHTNAGLISHRDLRVLSPFNASMGLMLETTAHVKAHKNSPGKDPNLRIEYMAEAGRLKIPFTTGIMVGIGESWMDREDSLRKIAELHRKFGHIQEVIIQPLDPKPGTALENRPKPSVGEVADVINLARNILPSEVAVQLPPNLIDPLPLVKAGANDLGGLSTITPDWINPDKPWPALKELACRLKGYAIKERLPVHPHFVLKRWYGQKTGDLIKSLADDAGLRRKDYL